MRLEGSEDAKAAVVGVMAARSGRAIQLYRVFRNVCEGVRHRYGSGTRDGDGRAAGARGFTIKREMCYEQAAPKCRSNQ
jgi:hypothetical protein